MDFTINPLILQKKMQREVYAGTNWSFQRSLHVTPSMIKRLGLNCELEGHMGCVNCIEWNEKGTLLASGSDDVQVMIWDPFRRKKLACIRTGHQGNIFSVKFLPSSGDNAIVTGAADSKIRVHDVSTGETTNVFTCHASRVKRIATSAKEPFMFWSAAEDGCIMEFDLRCPELSKGNAKNVLINLDSHVGGPVEFKCIAMNPVRPEMMAVGANDPYVRVYDRRMLSCQALKSSEDGPHRFSSSEEFPLPRGCVEYYVPGHKPQKKDDYRRKLRALVGTYITYSPDGTELLVNLGGEQIYGIGSLMSLIVKAWENNEIKEENADGHIPQKKDDYRRKLRALAATYITYSPDGTELLVNLGGEQIYLYDVNKKRRMQKFDMSMVLASNGFVKDSSHSSVNGFSTYKNGSSTNGVTNGVAKHIQAMTSDTGIEAPSEDKHTDKKPTVDKRPLPPSVDALKKKANACFEKEQPTVDKRPLPPSVDALKKKANACFEKEQYTKAIILYNQAIALAPNASMLYGNRAAAYMKRKWDGDMYAALRDCHNALRLDLNHLKAHFRLAKCLNELCWPKEAFECLNHFKTKFPDYATSRACEQLDKDIRAAIFAKTESDDKSSKSRDHDFIGRVKFQPSELEEIWRAEANDYESRFCGHCNTTTDIKEANFFGSNGQYIVAGSDDGSFFIWEKSSTNIVRVLRGDDSIVNCLQPHPSFCLLATSGIDPVVRLWTPQPEDGSKNEREVDNSDDAALANQKRMNADPLEVMLMNMGYRLSSSEDGDGDRDRSNDQAQVTCPTS